MIFIGLVLSHWFHDIALALICGAVLSLGVTIRMLYNTATIIEPEDSVVIEKWKHHDAITKLTCITDIITPDTDFKDINVKGLCEILSQTIELLKPIDEISK